MTRPFPDRSPAPPAEPVRETTYRGYRIVQYASGDGSWVIYNALGHRVDTNGFNTAWSAICYIDEKEAP